MKNLFLIGGTMGVGKSATGQIIKEKLDNSVYLDGDWCWDMHPFQVTAETKQLVMGNIQFLLNRFLQCSVYDHIVFCWVMHEQAILDEILSQLDTSGCHVHLISLVCTEQALRERLKKDIETGSRTEDVIARSVGRLAHYEKLNTFKVDVSAITAEQAAELVIAHCH